ncbi:hypothetical protein IJ425_04120 [bacterium]|nr:hypothetical protein [bacterium]
MTFQPQFQANRWTLTAAECYSNGCNCSTCDMPLMLETKCQMKRIVFELVRKFGAPDIEEIKQKTPKGFTKY